MTDETPKSWKKLFTTALGAGSIGIADWAGLPEHLIWPIAVVVSVGLIAQAISDYAKYRGGK